MRRRHILAAVGALPCVPLLAARAAEGAYPDRPVVIVNPFAPGGYTDVVARLMATRLQRALGQPFVVENRAGAGTTIGARSVARAAPDGHTLLYGSTSAFVIAPYVYPDAGYDPTTSFVALGAVSGVATVLAARRGAGFGTVVELVAAARARPGAITYASSGNGSFPHVIGALFETVAGVRLTHVPYRGGGPAMNDLVAGNVDLFFDAVTTVAPHVTGGRIGALLVTGDARVPLLPSVPTAVEAGFPDLDLLSWTGMAAPAGTPAPIVATLEREIEAAVASDELRLAMARLGLDPAATGRAAMSARITREAAIYKRIIASAAVRAE